MLQRVPATNLVAVMAALPELDLADEADWEDQLFDGRIECCSLEEAGLEEVHGQPVFGGFYGDATELHLSGGVYEYMYWLMDGQINLED
jgi:hypothetical protein